LDILEHGLDGVPEVTFRDYTVTFIATSGTTQTISSTTSFNLKVKNPCVDPLYVNIVKPAEPQNASYTIYTTSIPVFYTKFIIETVPTRISPLCGSLLYRIFYEDNEIFDDSSPVSTTPDPTDNTLNVFSLDNSLADTSGVYKI